MLMTHDTFTGTGSLLEAIVEIEKSVGSDFSGSGGLLRNAHNMIASITGKMNVVLLLSSRHLCVTIHLSINTFRSFDVHLASETFLHVFFTTAW
jgi:hypothetical protein